MRLHRVKTVVEHTAYHIRYSMESLVDMFWFSITDVVIFGLISLFFVQQTDSQTVVFILQGIIFWEVVRVGQYSVAIGAMWEIWSKSLSTLFVTPLTLNEFLAGQMISSLFKASIACLLTVVLAAVFFNYSIVQLGLMTFVYLGGFLLFAWAMGMFALALIIRYGTDIQSLSWSLIFLFQPIGTFFYPVETLPKVLQLVARAFPPMYLNEAARYQLFSASINWNYIAIAYISGAFYFILCYWFIHQMFKQALENGRFSRMEG